MQEGKSLAPEVGGEQMGRRREMCQALRWSLRTCRGEEKGGAEER